MNKEKSPFESSAEVESFAELEAFLINFRGASFVSIDTETEHRGFTKRTKGASALIFGTGSTLDYEALVNRKLLAAGGVPSFRSGPLPWGERVGDSPLISHSGNLYLQSIILQPGTSAYYVGRHQVDGNDLPEAFKRRSDMSRLVVVSTFKLTSLVRMNGFRFMWTKEGGIDYGQFTTFKAA